MVLLALGVVLAFVVVEVAVSSVAGALRDVPTPLERTIRCLRFEKGLEVSTPPRDLIAGTADNGALSTVVEGNPVTLSIASDEEGAIRLVSLYERVSGVVLGTRLERRGRNVYLFLTRPSPTQRQILYDCAY